MLCKSYETGAEVVQEKSLGSVVSHTVARCKKCKGFRRNWREKIKPIGPYDLHSVETMRYWPAFRKLFHFPLKNCHLCYLDNI